MVDEELRAVDAIIDLAASGPSVGALSEGAGVITDRDPRARLTDLPTAMRALESGLVRGKIVATV